MTAIRVSLADTYSPGSQVEVDPYEGYVHVEFLCDDTKQPSLTPDAARALAAVLVHQADIAEGNTQ